tara:strand:+ start:10601 stop:11965 length:1365 start_codon:yes stop_codon:yes gene_type:complete
MRPIVIALVVVSILLAEICGIWYFLDVEEFTVVLDEPCWNCTCATVTHASFPLERTKCIRVWKNKEIQLGDFGDEFGHKEQFAYVRTQEWHCDETPIWFCELPMQTKTQWKQGIFTIQMIAWLEKLRLELWSTLRWLQNATYQLLRALWLTACGLWPIILKCSNMMRALYFVTWSHYMHRWFEMKVFSKNMKPIYVSPLQFGWHLCFMMIPFEWGVFALIPRLVLSYVTVSQKWLLQDYSVIQYINYNRICWDLFFQDYEQGPQPCDSFVHKMLLYGVVSNRDWKPNPRMERSLWSFYKYTKPWVLDVLRLNLSLKCPKLKPDTPSRCRETITKKAHALLLCCLLSCCRLGCALLNVFGYNVPSLEWSIVHWPEKLCHDDPVFNYFAGIILLCIIYRACYYAIDQWHYTCAVTFCHFFVLMAHVYHVVYHVYLQLSGHPEWVSKWLTDYFCPKS